MSSWHSYPSIFNLGHKYIQNIFSGDVTIEEKVDGSQLSFGIINGELKCRSKGATLNIIAPEKMFAKAVEVIKELRPLLREGWTYRGEYLMKAKHNVLAYDRTPNNHIIIFDINTEEETYLSYEEKQKESSKLGLEVVPLIYKGKINSPEQLRGFLDRESILGGQKIEGVVAKNYELFGQDKKVLMAKFVSESFKEIHSAEWKNNNPTQKDIIQIVINTYKTPARWQKAVIHLKEKGLIENSLKDVGQLMKEVPQDVEKECAGEIKDTLYKYFWPQIRRALTSGLPEWYKEELIKEQFNKEI